MKTIKDSTTLETRRTVRVEFTHAEIAAILLSHWHTVGKTTPLDMSVVRKAFDVVEETDSLERLVLTVDFHKVEASGPERTNDAPGPVPQYWSCVVTRKGVGDEIRYVFGPDRNTVGRKLREVYPDMLRWDSTKSATLPPGVKQTEVLEVLS